MHGTSRGFIRLLQFTLLLGAVFVFYSNLPSLGLRQIVDRTPGLGDRLLPLYNLADSLRIPEAHAAAQGDGILVNGATSTGDLYRRVWTGSWSATSTIVTEDPSVRWVVTKASPTRDEIISVQLIASSTTDALLVVTRWNGTSSAWTVDWCLQNGASAARVYGGTTCGKTTSIVPNASTTVRAFDLAYENTSGDAMVLYSSDAITTNELQYRTWNGSAWSATTTLDTARLTGRVRWVELTSQPTSGSDQLTALFSDTNLDLSAMKWTGTTWGTEPAAALETALQSADKKNFDGQYEGTSGEFIAAWGIATAGFKYVTSTAAGAWGTVTANTTAPGEIHANLDLAADPVSDQIVMGSNDAGAASDNQCSLWNGSSWSTIGQCDAASGNAAAGYQVIGGGWLTDGTNKRGIIVYADAAGTTLDWWWIDPNAGTPTWTVGTAFAITGAASAVSSPIHVQMNPFNRAELLAFVGKGAGLHALKLTLSGSTLTWTNPQGAALQTIPNTSVYMPFGFAYNRVAAAVVQTLTIGVTAGSQVSTLNSGDVNQFMNTLTCNSTSTCAAFTLSLSSGTSTLSSIKLTETGTLNADTDMSNWALYYSTSSVGSFASGSLQQYGIGMPTSTGETITFTNNASTSLLLTSGTTYYFFPSFDLKSQLPPSSSTVQTFPKGGQTFDLQIATTTDIVTNVTTTKAGTFPVALPGSTTILPQTDAGTRTVGGDGRVKDDYTGADEGFFAVAMDSQYIYGAGYDMSPGNYAFHIQKRDKVTGTLVTAFGASSTGRISDNFSAGTDLLRAIAMDSQYIYLAGSDASPGADFAFHIQKRDKTTGALITTFGASSTGRISDNYSANNDELFAITVDSQYIYVAGGDGSPGSGKGAFHIQKRDKTTGALITAFNTTGRVSDAVSTNVDQFSGIVVDSQYIYAAGRDEISGATNDAFHIQKRDKTTGALVTAFGASSTGRISDNFSTGLDSFNDIRVDLQYIYAAGVDSSPSATDSAFHIQKRDKTTGALIAGFGTGGRISENYVSGSGFNDSFYMTALDSQYMYAAGFDGTPGGTNGNFHIQKRLLSTGTTTATFGDGGKSGDSVTLSGYGFGVGSGGTTNCAGAVDTGCTRFLVGGTSTVAAASITSWTNTAVTFTVSSTLASVGGVSTLDIVSGSQATPTDLTYYIYPNVTSLVTIGTNAAREYNASDTDGLVMLSGDHFGVATGTVSILGATSTLHNVVEGTCSAAGWSGTLGAANNVCAEASSSIVDTLYTGNIILTRNSDSKTSTFSNFRILPRILTNTPTSTSVGSVVQIKGDHFCESGTCPVATSSMATSSDNVKFGNTTSSASDFQKLTGGAGACNGSAAFWADSEICVKVPSGASGSASTTVTSNTYTSNNKAFSVLSSTPNSPTNLAQFQDDGTTPLGSGSSTASTTVVLKADISSSLSINMALQVEATSSASFACSGTSTCASALEGATSTGGACTGCTSLSAAKVTVSGLAEGSYIWQARVRNTTTNEYSAWVLKGASPDFRIDLTLPVISSISSGSPGTNSATITWTTNEGATTQVQYNTTGSFVANCATNNDCNTLDSSLLTSHSVSLSNLNSGTTYYYRVRSKDAANNEAISSNNSFVTTSVNKPTKTTRFFVAGITGSIAAGQTTSTTFTVFMPENATATKSIFLEIRGIYNAAGGSPTIGVSVNGQATTTYALPSAAATSSFKIVYQVNSINLSPATNTASLNPTSATLYVNSAQLIFTYAYTP